MPGTTERYACARHGEHDAIIQVEVYQPAPHGQRATAQREVAMTRRYCMHCYIEHMDKAGVHDMDPVK